MGNYNIESSKALYTLKDKGELGVLRKSQKTKNAYNYFFAPVLSLVLRNARVLVSNDKYIVFQFDKSSSLSLLQMLRNVNDCLYDTIKSLFVVEAKTSYSLVSEQETTFTIRVSLSKKQNKYNVTMFNNEFGANDGELFRCPRKDTVFELVQVEIQNIWEKDNVCGYNVVLKGIKV